MTRGYAADEVELVYARARELCEKLGDTPQLCPVSGGSGRSTWCATSSRPPRSSAISSCSWAPSRTTRLDVRGPRGPRRTTTGRATSPPHASTSSRRSPYDRRTIRRWPSSTGRTTPASAWGTSRTCSGSGVSRAGGRRPGTWAGRLPIPPRSLSHSAWRSRRSSTGCAEGALCQELAERCIAITSSMALHSGSPTA